MISNVTGGEAEKTCSVRVCLNESSFSLALKGVSSVFFGDKILMSKYI